MTLNDQLSSAANAAVTPGSCRFMFLAQKASFLVWALGHLTSRLMQFNPSRYGCMCHWSPAADPECFSLSQCSQLHTTLLLHSLYWHSSGCSRVIQVTGTRLLVLQTRSMAHPYTTPAVLTTYSLAPKSCLLLLLLLLVCPCELKTYLLRLYFIFTSLHLLRLYFRTPSSLPI